MDECDTDRSELCLSDGNGGESVLITHIHATDVIPGLRWPSTDLTCCTTPMVIMNNLGNSLFRRFERVGDLADINKSVSMKEHAVYLTPDGHPSKPARLNNLGNSLSRRFQGVDDLADINKSISMCEQAVELTPTLHKPAWFNNLLSSSSTYDLH